jgi:hypothetical protein
MIAYLQSTKAPHNPQPWISSLPHSRGDQAFEEQEEWVQSCGLTGWFACCCCCYCCLLWVPTSSRKSRAHTHTLSILLRLSSSSWVFVLCSSPTRESERPNSPLQRPYKSIRRTQPSSPAALQEYPKDATVLSSSPTRVSEGPNRPLQQPYKSIWRTQPSSTTGLQGNLKDPFCPLALALQVIQRNHALSAAALRGVWKTSSIPLQQPYKGNLKDLEWEFQSFLQSPLSPSLLERSPLI